MGLGEGMNLNDELCRFCKSNKVLIKQFNRPPKGETDFGFCPTVDHYGSAPDVSTLQINTTSISIQLFIKKHTNGRPTKKKPVLVLPS